jgi:hypothetical protein
MPADDVLRFETREGGYGTTSDIRSGRRRSTLNDCGPLSDPYSGYNYTWVSGETLWVSMTLVIGDYSTNHATNNSTLVCAAGSTPSSLVGGSRGGCWHVRFTESELSIATRSSEELYAGSTNGVPIDRVLIPKPPKGAETHIVLAVTLGSDGHLTAWINGENMFDADVPIGYYAVDTLLSGMEAGLYTWGGPDPDVMYLCNFDYGTGSLAARVAAPLSVPDLDW